MKLPFFNSIFKKRENFSQSSHSDLTSKLKSLTTQSQIMVFENVQIYHQSKSFTLPLVAFDPLRGIILFESKQWTFSDLKNAKITKAKHQMPSQNTLAFDNMQTQIKQKIKELTHSEPSTIYNFVLFEALDSQAYAELNDSIKEHFVFERLIFSDYDNSDIFKALQNIPTCKEKALSCDGLLSALFIQYTFLDNFKKAHFANDEQRLFLESELLKLSSLNGPALSGKSTLLLLKSIILLMSKKHDKVIILEPTLLAADLLKKRLLDMIEYSIIAFDLNSLEIITPLELLNRHLQKLKKSPSLSVEEIDNSLINKDFTIADVVMCDDTHLLPPAFVEYLKSRQHKSKLLLVQDICADSFTLDKNYKKERGSYYFFLTNPYAKTLQLAQSLLQESDSSVMIISSEATKEKLREDFTGFLDKELSLIYGSNSLVVQKFSPLMLASYDDINALSAKHIIILDICTSNLQKVEYACNRASQATYLLYEEECEEIIYLKDQYESNQE